MNEEDYLNAIKKNLEKGDKISLRQATLNLIDLYDLLVTETLSKINLSNYNNVDFNKKSMLIELLLELSEETTTTLKDIWNKIRGKFAHNREYFTPPKIIQYYLAKYQSVVKEFNDKIPSSLTPNYLKQLWEAEAELFPKPSANSFIEIFENINKFPDLPLNDLYREKFSLGLLEYHLKVDLTIPSNNILNLLLDEIFHRINETIFNLESFVSLLNSLNKTRQGFFDHYRADDKRTCKLLGSNWYEVLESDYNPNVLTAFIREIRKADSLVSDDFCKSIFDYFAKSFPVSFSQNKNLILLNNTSKIHSEIIHLLPKLTWERVERIRISDLEPLLNGINTIILQIITSYKEGLERHQINLADEEKQVKKSFIFAFLKELTDNVKWGELEWDSLSIENINEFFGNFNRYLEFPEEIMDSNWSNYLRKSWKKTPESVLTLLANKHKFRSLYLKNFPKKGVFPEISDFVSSGSLGLLVYFLVEILDARLGDRSGVFDFIDHSSFSQTNLLPLISNSYYPAIYGLQRFLADNHQTKLTSFQPPSIELKENNNFLNRYHKATSSLFHDINPHIVISSQDFIENAASYAKEYSWYWSWLTLPCFLDVLLIIREINDREERKSFTEGLIKSIQEKSELWNDLFNHNFYINSFQDFYPGTQKFDFLKEETRITHTEPSLDELKLFHYLGLSNFFYIISKNKDLQSLVETLVERTRFLDFIFDEDFLNKVEWKKSLRIPSDYDLYFSFSRKLDNHFTLRNLLTTAIYHSPTEAYLNLLANNNPKAMLIKQRIDELGLNDFFPHPQDLARRNPDIFSRVLRLKMQGAKGALNEWTEMWIDLFGLTRIEEPITSLGIGVQTLKTLSDLPDKKDEIIEATPWNIHLSKMTLDEIKILYNLYEERFFMKRGGNTQINSFIEGIITIFSTWYDFSILKFSNRLVSLTDLIYRANQIEELELKNKYLNKISVKLESENWASLILNNLEDEDPLREVMNFFEVSESFLVLDVFLEKVIKELFSDQETFSKYFKTFWEVFAFVEWLHKRLNRNKELYSQFLTKFFILVKELPLSIKPTGYFGRIGDLFNYLKSKIINIPEMQNILIKQEFLIKLKNRFIKQVEENEYFLKYLPKIQTELINLDRLELIDRKQFMCEILDSISMNKLFIENKRVWRNLSEIGNENDEFIEMLVNRVQFKELDWTNLSTHEDWYSYLSFVRDISNCNEKLIRGIIANPTFWDIEWIPYVKTWLLGCNKEIITFFTFLDSFSDEHFVKSFLTSSKLLKCPWDNCYSQILNRSKESSSLLSKEEFKSLLELLVKFNSAFENLMKSK